MSTRLDFCREEILKHQNEHNKLIKVAQELNNLLPTYKEKVILQELVKELRNANQSA
ncbi:hypothetical protein U8V72_18425 [Priestia filamentosa]|uniref:hypothetical protein n=1 Tax=Priestia filamentosa TaxID=1402861 RepID=UPI000AAA3747